MTVKLKKLKPEYTDKFVIVVEFMHGDADAYTKEEYVCKDEADFIRVMSAPEGPQDPSSGGDEDVYREFYADLFKDDSFVPGDCTYLDIPACVYGWESYYYDKDGTKYEATL